MSQDEIACAVLGVVALAITNFLTWAKTDFSCTNIWKKSALENGYAKWVVDEKTGQRTFVWNNGKETPV